MIQLLLAWLLAPLALIRLALTNKPATPQRILLIQTAKIGDYISTTPLIRAIRQSYPDASLDLLVHPVNEPLARHQPGVSQVFTPPDGRIRGFAGRLWLYRLLRTGGFDTTICISPNLAFMTIPLIAGVRHRACILPNRSGRSYRLAAPMLTVREVHRQGRMMVETGMALLHQLGVDGPLPVKEIAPAPGAAERISTVLPTLHANVLIGVGVSSGNKLKELGQAKLTALVHALLELNENAQIVLVGTAGDRTLASAVRSATKPERVIDTTGLVPLEDLAALIDRLSAFVGVDSGITYLADARGIPVVDIMGPADPEDQRPTGKNAIVIHSALPCAPCSHAFSAPYLCAIKTRACIANTDITSVATAVRKILK